MSALTGSGKGMLLRSGTAQTGLSGISSRTGSERSRATRLLRQSTAGSLRAPPDAATQTGIDAVLQMVDPSAVSSLKAVEAMVRSDNPSLGSKKDMAMAMKVMAQSLQSDVPHQFGDDFGDVGMERSTCRMSVSAYDAGLGASTGSLYRNGRLRQN